MSADPSQHATPPTQTPEARPATVSRYAEAEIPTEYGLFRVVVYRESVPDGASAQGPSAQGPSVEGPAREHLAIICGDISEAEGVHIRVHSECLTGEVLHSLKCDCREQLDFALRHISERTSGAVLYLRQEGRGIGLGNKIRAYALQEGGADTVDANRMLGFDDDLRSYHVATDMLADLGVASIVLLTNNPAKVEGLRQDGVRVEERLAVHIPPNEHNRGYLETKQARMGHVFSELGELRLDSD